MKHDSEGSMVTVGFDDKSDSVFIADETGAEMDDQSIVNFFSAECIRMIGSDGKDDAQAFDLINRQGD